MTEQKSKKLFAFEFALIVVPYAVVGSALLFTFVFAALLATRLSEGLGALALAAACGVPLWCGLHLSNKYRHGGRQQLAVAHGAWWWGMAPAAVLPIAGVSAWLLISVVGNFALVLTPSSEIQNPHQLMAADLRACILFAPLLLPFVHLFKEQRAAQSSNKSLNMDTPKDGAPIS